MSETGNIQYVPHHHINKEKWDSCIENAGNGLIYAYSFYLDTMSPGWDAIVFNDYETVMPLTWKKKWGTRYLYQPFLAAQLGVFGNDLTPAAIELFLQSIPPDFRLIEISLNSSNHFNKVNPSLFERKNYLLHLNKNYPELYSEYNDNTKRNLKRSVSNRYSVTHDFNVEEVIYLAILQMDKYGKESSENVNRFRTLYNILHEKKMSSTYGIRSDENKLLASCVFFYSHNRVYYILVGNHPDSKATGASHALIDACIREYAGKIFPGGKENWILDFEGSDILSLAQFYSGFGAIPEIYPALKINRLPFFIRWLKK